MYRYILTALSVFILTVSYFFTHPKIEYVPVINKPIVFEIKTPPMPTTDFKQVECLALNIYHEARGESLEGKVAVSQVVMNRVKSNYFPNTICDVIYQARYSNWWKENHGRNVPVINQCQFSWYCDGKSDTPKDMKAWGDAISIASDVVSGKYPDISSGAMFYHADYVQPYWAATMQHVVQVDDHIFYAHPKYQ